MVSAQSLSHNLGEISTKVELIFNHDNRGEIDNILLSLGDVDNRILTYADVNNWEYLTSQLTKMFRNDRFFGKVAHAINRDLINDVIDIIKQHCVLDEYGVLFMKSHRPDQVTLMDESVIVRIREAVDYTKSRTSLGKAVLDIELAIYAKPSGDVSYVNVGCDWSTTSIFTGSDVDDWTTLYNSIHNCITHDESLSNIRCAFQGDLLTSIMGVLKSKCELDHSSGYGRLTLISDRSDQVTSHDESLITQLRTAINENL